MENVSYEKSMYQSKQYYEYKNFRLVGKKKVVKINKLHQYFIFDLSKNNNKIY